MRIAIVDDEGSFAKDVKKKYRKIFFKSKESSGDKMFLCQFYS